MLETPKAQGATNAKNLEDEVKAEMDNQQVTREEIGWLAGFIDGEGYIGISLNKNHSNGCKTIKVEMSVCNTDKAMIDKYVAIINKLGSNPYLKKQKKYKCYNGDNKKDVYRATLHRMGPLFRVLKAFLPHLTGQKKTRAELIYEFLESRLWKSDKCKGVRSIPYTEREIEIIHRCLELQKRGTSETTRRAELEAHQRKADGSIEKKCAMAAKMLKLQAEGMSLQKIANECGFSKNPQTNSGSKVGWWLKRLHNNEAPIQILGYFPKAPFANSDDIVRPSAKA
jgi:hypothetical protein